MRRMYSEQELSKIIKEVVDAEVASGEFDETIADYVDAYLVEHPVDITALEGQTINPARIDVANINGETNPSVKPIYFHGIEMYSDTNLVTATITILNNSDTPIDTFAKLKTWAETIANSYGVVRIPAIGDIKVEGSWYSLCFFRCRSDGEGGFIWDIYYQSSSGRVPLLNIDLEDYYSNITDSYNKIN